MLGKGKIMLKKMIFSCLVYHEKYKKKIKYNQTSKIYIFLNFLVLIEETETNRMSLNKTYRIYLLS